MALKPQHTEWEKFHQPWQTLGYTTLFALGISVMSWLFDGQSDWGTHVVVSLSIGWSIVLAFIALNGLMNRVLNPYVAPIPIITLGLSIGLIISGWLVTNNMWYFFAEDFSTLVTGIFFGVVGTTIFATRARLKTASEQLVQAHLIQERQEKLMAESELKILQAQIEPHFLFNTLSNIAGLIRHNPDAAEQTLVNLTTLLRAALGRTRTGHTTLAQELEIAKAYLEIQSIRMQGRLTYRITCAPGAGHVPLPPLLVQPLVENAVKHGIDPSESGGQILVDAALAEQMLTITVTDTGIGFQDHPPTRGTGTGLGNIRERLAAIFGDRASLTLHEHPPQGTRAQLTLPGTGIA